MVWNTAVVITPKPIHLENEITAKATGKAIKKPTPTSIMASFAADLSTRFSINRIL